MGFSRSTSRGTQGPQQTLAHLGGPSTTETAAPLLPGSWYLPVLNKWSRFLRLLFSFSLTMKIMDGEGRLDANEVLRGMPPWLVTTWLAFKDAGTVDPDFRMVK